MTGEESLDIGPHKIQSLETLDIREEGLVKLLQNLDGHKALGPDTFVKDHAIQLAPMLTKIFQKSLS